MGFTIKYTIEGEPMPKRILNIIIFCIKKNWRQFVAIILLLVIFWSGFYTAWKLQEHKIERYETIIVKVGILLVRWDKKLEKLEKEKEKIKKEREKRKGWSESTWVEE